MTKIDFGDAPTLEMFRGRNEEINQLTEWILNDKSRVVGVIGNAGVGKSLLVTRLGVDLEGNFDYIFWRSLRDKPNLESILQECLLFISDQAEIHLPDDVARKISILIAYFRKQRCLLILDNIETIFQTDVPSVQGQQNITTSRMIDEYNLLTERIGSQNHRSCLMFTSREKTVEFERLEATHATVKSLRLNGVKVTDGQKMLKTFHLAGTNEDWEKFVEIYSGNPQAMRLIAATTIVEDYSGDISLFLREGNRVSLSVRDIVDKQCSNIPEIEQHLMYWLAIERTPVTVEQLRANIIIPSTKTIVRAGLESLHRKSLVELTRNGYTLQNYIMECITEQLIEKLEVVANYIVTHVVQEIASEELSLLRNLSLMKAQTKDYIRQTQIRMILVPIIEALIARFGKKNVEDKLIGILEKVRESSNIQPGYAGGNVLNLLTNMNSDLHHHDLSHLAIWQAYLQGVELHDVDFSYSDLNKSVFTETFSLIMGVDISPDGKLLASGSADGQVRTWKIADGKQLYTASGHTDWVWKVRFSPDSRLLASCGDDYSVRLWDAFTGTPFQVFKGHTNWVRALCFSPSGQILASGGEDQTILLWDIQSGKVETTLSGHQDKMWSLAFSPDGVWLVGASGDSHVYIWDVNSHALIKVIEAGKHYILDARFSPDGQYLATTGDDTVIRIWDTAKWQLVRELSGHTDRVWSLTFSPNSVLLTSSSEDKTIRIWNTQTGECEKTLQGHTNWVRSVVSSPDGATLVSGSDDCTIRLWDSASGYSIRTIQGYTNPVWSLAISPDGKYLLTSNEDQTLRLWNVDSGKIHKTFRGYKNRAWAVTYSPNGNLLASGGDDQNVYIWNSHSGHLDKKLVGHIKPVWSVVFSPDNKYLASSSEDKTVHVWNVETGDVIGVLQGHPSWVRTVTFHPLKRLLASGGDDPAIRIWDFDQQTLIQTLEGFNGRIWSVAFSPDGQKLVAGGDDGRIRVWNIESNQITQVLEGHTGRIWSVKMSEDGRQIVSSSSDMTVRLWDAETGKILHILEDHSGWVRSVTFSSTQPLVFSGSEDGKVDVWDMNQGSYVKSLRPDRLYERLNITGVTGITDAEKASLKSLGAYEEAIPTSHDRINSVFISYRRTSYGEAAIIQRGLDARGISTFLDVDSITEGRFADIIEKGIENCSVFVIVLAPDTLESVWVRREIVHALRNKKRIIPVLIKHFIFDSEIPDEVQEIQNFNSVSLFIEYTEPALDRLARFIQMARSHANEG